jgi:glycosyltransferase involved in cell wall biosynthesis
MNSLPLVSIITPFFNAEKFFEEAIESVLAQTYKNWELLLVDDGSTDGSTAIAQRYAQQYPEKVRYLEHKQHRNCGKSVSRNLGISHAGGEYIGFLDADDVFLPRKLEHQVAIMESQPEAGMVYGAQYKWYGWTGKRRDIRRDYKAGVGVQPDTLCKPPTLLTLFLRDGRVIPGTCSLLVRRHIVEALGGFEETIQHIFEDQVLLAKICLKFPVFVEAGCWDKYRQHPDSSCYQAIRNEEYHPLKPNPAHRTFLTWLGRYCSAQNIQDPDLWSAYHKALWPYQHLLLAHMLVPVRYLFGHLPEKIRVKIEMLVWRTWLRFLVKNSVYQGGLSIRNLLE